MTDSRKTDTGVAELINELRKGAHANKAPIWKDIAMRLEKPNRSWAEVNVGKLPDVASKGRANCLEPAASTYPSRSPPSAAPGRQRPRSRPREARSSP